MSPSASLGRVSSNLAIAAPLIPTLTPPNSYIPQIQIRQDTTRASFSGLEEDDDFSPFVVKPPSHNPALALGKPPSEAETQWSASSASNSSPPNSYDIPPYPDDYYAYPSPLQRYAHPEYLFQADSSGLFGSTEVSYDGDYIAEGDLTPFEILSNIFGDSVPASTLETALASSGYDFEGAMAWLVDQALPQPVPGAAPQSSHHALRSMGGGVVLASRDGPYGHNGINGKSMSGRHGSPQKSSGANRVCRYFLAGECKRADCRFR